MKKILIPTNFSKETNEVIAFALEAFNDEPCVFYFLHTYPYADYDPSALRSPQEKANFFEKIDMLVFKKMLKQVGYFAKQEAYEQHNFKLLCKNCEFIDGLVDAVASYHIDIVLMGSKGKKAGTQKFPEEKINLAVEAVRNCPLMVLPLGGAAWERLGLENIKLAG